MHPTSTMNRPATGAVGFPHSQIDQIAAALYPMLFTAPPRRCATMTITGKDKYRDVKIGSRTRKGTEYHQLMPSDIADHLNATRTWAATLAGRDDMARAGCRDYDAGGEDTIMAALSAAADAGIVAFGILIPGAGTAEDHDGGHVWTFYNQPAPVKDIKYQLAQLPGAKGEIYPSGNNIRLPFGLHRRKGTRGTLLLQDGRRFDLDQPDQFELGLRTFLSLRRNPTPATAPAQVGSSTSGGTFGESDPANWEGLPNGAALMNSPRYRMFFSRFEQLARLARGERVALRRDGALDDTDSAQVAALVYNLIRSKEKGKALGDGAPPENEIRAIALSWRDKLRPGVTLEKYRAHVDYEINRNRPETYRPESTKQLGKGQNVSMPVDLAPSETKRGRGRPAGVSDARNRRLNQIEGLLAIGETYKRGDLGRAFGVTARQITMDLDALKEAGRIQIKQVQHGFRVEGKIPQGGRKNTEIQGGNYELAGALQSDPVCIGETPPPPFHPVALVEPVMPIVESIDLTADDIADNAGPVALSDDSQGTTGGACVSPLAEQVHKSTAPARLPDLVREAFSKIPELYERLDKRTGEIKPGNVTVERVHKYVRSQLNGGRWQDWEIDRAIAAERYDRGPFAQEREKARNANSSDLKTRAKSTASAYAQRAKKGHPRAEYSGIIAGIWAAEEARRDAIEEENDRAAYEALETLQPAPAQPAPVAPPVEQPGLFDSPPDERFRPFGSIANAKRLASQIGREYQNRIQLTA